MRIRDFLCCLMLIIPMALTGACSGDATIIKMTDRPGSDDPDPDPDPQVAGCDTSGFEVASDAAVGSTGPSYQAVNQPQGVEPFDMIGLTSYLSSGGPTSPGTVVLDGINYKDCTLCLLIQTNCLTGSQGTSCEKILYADEGTINITKLDEEHFAANFSGVKLKEVTIASDYTSTPVEGGATWCLDGFSFDKTIPIPQPTAGQKVVGDAVEDFQLQNCETGEMVSVHTYNDGLALWFVATAGWCSACHLWIPDVLIKLGEESDRGLKVMFVLGEDMNYGQPTLDYCKSYANQYDVDDASLFYIDHDGSQYGSWKTTFGNLWQYPDSQGSYYLPWNGVLDGDNLYTYADQGHGGANVMTVVDQLLDVPAGAEGGPCLEGDLCDPYLVCHNQVCKVPGVEGGPCNPSDDSCNAGLQCYAGTCVVPAAGSEGGACLAGDTCNEGLVCQDALCVTPPAGAEYGPCYENGSCDAGLICADDVCELLPAGSEGGPCYANNTCDGDLACTDNFCMSVAAAGAEGGVCYGNGTCDGSLVCMDDVCTANTPAPGSQGGACYGNNTCDGDLVCTDDVCVAGATPDTGSEGGACYGNGTCNGDLVCTDDVCAPADGGGD